MTAFLWTILLAGRAVAGEPPVAVLALTGSAGVGARTMPDVGVRAALVPTLGSSAVEVGIAAARGLPVRLDGGSFSLTPVLVSVRFGPDVAGGAVRVRPTVGLAAGLLVVAGSGFPENHTTTTGRLVAPEVALAVERESVHLGLAVATPLWGRVAVVGGDGSGRVAVEPAIRIGLELGVVIPTSRER